MGFYLGRTVTSEGLALTVTSHAVLWGQTPEYRAGNASFTKDFTVRK